MNEDDQQSTNIQDYVTQAKVPGEKVIQPSAALIEEMKAVPKLPQLPIAPPATPQPTQTPQSTSVLPVSQTPLRPPSPSSAYPEVTRGIGSETPGNVLPTEVVSSPPKQKVMAVKMVARVLALIKVF